MKYFGMSFGMWELFRASFEKNLVYVLHYDISDAAKITGKAKQKYKELLRV